MESIEHGGRWEEMDPSRWIWVWFTSHALVYTGTEHWGEFLASRNSLQCALVPITSRYQNNSAEEAGMLTVLLIPA